MVQWRKNLRIRVLRPQKEYEMTGKVLMKGQCFTLRWRNSPLRWRYQLSLQRNWRDLDKENCWVRQEQGGGNWSSDSPFWHRSGRGGHEKEMTGWWEMIQFLEYLDSDTSGSSPLDQDQNQNTIWDEQHWFFRRKRRENPSYGKQIVTKMSFVERIWVNHGDLVKGTSRCASCAIADAFACFECYAEIQATSPEGTGLRNLQTSSNFSPL